MADHEKIFTFRLPEAVHNNLLKQALENGTTASDLMRSIIVEHLRVENILSKLDELDISRRFRELYAQARIANHALDALARATLGDKYDAWRTTVNQSLDQEVARKKSERFKAH